jgi:hypothetical protein
MIWSDIMLFYIALILISNMMTSKEDFIRDASTVADLVVPATS